MSRGCRFLLFWHHNYQVSLTPNATALDLQSQSTQARVTGDGPLEFNIWPGSYLNIQHFEYSPENQKCHTFFKT